MANVTTKDVFALDEMLTPKIITFVYWLLLLLAAFSGLQSMFGGYGGFTVEKFLTGLGIIVAGGVAARIW